jgi:hypothetical protein
MASITLGNPFSYSVHPASWRRPSGSRDYRVTNPFDGPDFLNGGKHRATDVGNFRVDDTVRAPVACRGRGLRHTDGALGVDFDLGHGIVVSLWHLNATLAPIGTWQPVAQGQVVGRTGNTGARLPDGSAMPAHTHIAATRDGVPFDIERHLPMPERAALPITIATGEDDVKIRGRFLRHEQNVRTTLTADSHFRSGDDWTTDSLGILSAGTLLYPVVTVEGRVVGTAANRAEWHGALAYVASAYHFGYVHSSVVTRFEPIAIADCSAQEQTIAQLRTKVSRARTSAAGAAQAATATVEALR